MSKSINIKEEILEYSRCDGYRCPHEISEDHYIVTKDDLDRMESEVREEARKIIDWATSDGTGSSSESLCRFMLGLPPTRGYYSYPHDAGDRGRCIRLLNRIPEWWDRLGEMAELPEHEVNIYSSKGLEIKKDGWKNQIPLIRKESEEKA